MITDSPNGQVAIGANLLAYQRELALSRIPQESIFQPGYLDKILCGEPVFFDDSDIPYKCGLYADHEEDCRVVTRFEGTDA